jgi:hypothetical protein
MLNSDTLATVAGAILIEKTEPRSEGLLAEHGASDPAELPRLCKANYRGAQSATRPP